MKRSMMIVAYQLMSRLMFVDDLDDIFAQETHLKNGSGSSSTAGDGLVIATALERLLEKVTTSSFEFADLVRGLVDDIETSRSSTTKTEKEIEL